MTLNTKRLFFIVFNCFVLTFLSAQTLYWVGGSGDFNNPQHWSLSSGGSSANQLPNSATDVVFDDNSGFGAFEVRFASVSGVKSFITNNQNSSITFNGVAGSRLNVGGSFNHTINNKFDYAGDIYFKSKDVKTHYIQFSNTKINASLYFQTGNYSISSLSMADGRKVSFENGNYKFKYASVKSDELIIKGLKTAFKIDTAAFAISEKVLITGQPSFESNSFGFFAPFNDSDKVVISQPVNFGNKSKLSSNTVNAVGDASLYALTSCSGSCSATFSFIIDAANTGTFDLVVSNFNCASTAGSLSATGLLPGVSHVVNNVCFCPSAAFNAFAYDPVTLVPLNIIIMVGQTSPGNFNFQPPTLAINPIVSAPPSCDMSCNGGMTLSIGGGASPYTVTVQGPVPSTIVTSGIIGLGALCKGSYTLIGTDANGCSSTPLVRNLLAPSQLVATPITSSISCKSSCTGSFSVTLNNTGTSGYSVLFSNGFSVTTTGSNAVGIASLCIGAVSATVTDARGCTVTTSGMITEPAASLTAVYSQTNLICNNVCSGAASASVSGGMAPYTYSWSPGAETTSLVTSLCAGTKTLIVRDVNNCTTSSQHVFNITQPPAITLTPTSTNVVCSGSCTGAASITASGGTGAFSYTWVAPGPSTIPGSTPGKTGLCAFPTNYTVSVRDANNCSNPPVLISITQPPTLTLSIATRSVSCFGLSDGSATVTASGGNMAPYTYSWSPIVSSSSVVTGLGPGSYSVQVRDAANCPVNGTVAIAQPSSGLSVVITQTNLTCHQGNAPLCDGRIHLTPTGGIPAYSYTLAGPISTITTSPPYNNLCTGAYTVQARDASGCAVTPSVINMTQPNIITPTITVTTPISCFGTSIGGLTGGVLNPPGGTPGYTLNWVTPSGAATGTNLINQGAGNYTLTVNDTRNCTATTSITFTSPTQMTVNVSTTTISCFNVCNGSISSTVSGGTAPYTYAWTNSLGISVGAGSTANALCPGLYTLTVTDALACTRTTVATVSSPEPLVLTQTATPVNCFGDSNGSATVTATGGTQPYLSYNFVSPTATITNITGVIGSQPTATFVVTVTDNAGCTQTISTAITSPTALAAVISGAGSCNVCNGTATITPSFGTAPYTYLWSDAGATIATTSTVGGLCPGNYTATVTDSKGCTITRTIAINQIISIGIIPAPATILCHGATTGSVGTSVSGGVPGYSYSWTPSGQTTSSLTGVGAGTYTLRVSDSSLPASCSHTMAVTLTEPPAITVTATQTHVTCFGFNNGAITTSVSGGTGPSYTYSWSPGGQITPGISNLIAGTYTLEVEDINLCHATQVYSVSQSPSITITHTATNPSGCAIPNGSICVTASGGSGSGYTYAWSPIAGTGNCISGLNGGTYQHTVTDGAGCSNTISVTLFNATGPTLTTLSNSVACFGNSTGVSTVTAVGAAPFTFTWTPAVSAANIANGSVGTGMSSGNYVITASDVNGCVTNTTVTIAQAPSVTINSSLSNARCNGVCDGSITVAPIQGTLTSPSFTYSWLPVTPTISGQGTRTVTGLCPNTYTLNLTDGNFCVTQHTFTISQPTAIVITAATTSVSCYSNCTGSIVVSATGGIGALNYSWTPVGGNTQTVTNLCATGGTNPASYTLTVTDQQNCTAVSTYTIAEPPPLTSTISFVNATCSNSCNAVASQTASGGIPGYTYAWSSSTLTASSIGSLCPSTTYTAYVTDANGCVHSAAYTTPSLAPLSVTLVPSSPLCYNACDGSVNTTISGAQGPVSYHWSPAGSGQNPTGLCAATPNTIYTLTVRDQNACQVTAVTTLTNPLELIAAVSATSPACFGDVNGTASVSVVNAVGAVSYSWMPTGVPPQTSQIASGLSAQVLYTVFVSDANQCRTSQTFSLAAPQTISLNIATDPASCGLPNGTITVHPSGGTPGSPDPYSYVWFGGLGTSSLVGDVVAGIYTVQVSDGLGCSTLAIIPLSNSDGPNVIPVVSSSITCHAQSTGAASVDIANIQGGTPPYSVNWIPPAPSVVNPLTNVPAGTYTAEVSDNVGCISYTHVSISEPPPLVNTTSVGFPLCPGICDGSISINVSGGNSPYTYSWMPTGETGTMITNVCSGDYYVIVGYNGVCADTTFINLPDQSSITIVPAAIDNKCFGDCNGMVALTVSGGTSPYVAGWSTGQTGLMVDKLCNDTYSVIVTDANGCVNTSVATVTSAPQIISNASVISPSCGVCNGSASLTVSGGSSPYVYNWSNSASTASVSGLCAGIYQVTISDALACTQTETVIINNSDGITSETFNVQGIPCSGSCVGSVTVSAVGGTQPINYNWINPALTNSVISNLCSGTYYVQMSDAAGCVRTASVAIDPLVSLTVSPFVYLPSCNTNDGSISLVIAGGTPSYNIAWNPPAGSSASLTNLGSGVYSYTVIESGINSCSVSHTLNLSNKTAPLIQASQSDVICFGNCTGEISASASGTSTPFSYLWSTGVNTQTISNLCKGVVSLSVTDAVGCIAMESFTITENPLLQLGIANVQNPSCSGDCDGLITLVPTGGVSPYTYTWSAEGMTSNPAISLCDGVYTASVADARGCVLTSPAYTINSASSVSLDVTTFNSSCSSAPDGSITLLVSGGVSEYSINWQGPSNFTSSEHNLANISSGLYTLSVTDGLGCRKDSSLLVSPSITVVAQAGADPVICPETGTVVLNAANSTGSSDYKWYKLGDRINSLGSGSTLFVGHLSEPTAYILVATATVATCASEDTVLVRLHNLPSVNAGRDFMVPVHSSVTIGGYPTHWTPATLLWSPSIYLNDSTVSNPIATNTINVTFTLTVTDANGCSASDSVRVHLYPELNITSGFTPNNDGKNDLWIIDYIEQFPDNTVEIYNRWGDAVFSSSGYQVPFDGKYKGADLPVGTYYYIIKLNHPGYPKPITGPLTIFR